MVGSAPAQPASAPVQEGATPSKAELKQARQQRAEAKQAIRARERFRSPSAIAAGKGQSNDFSLNYLFGPIPNRIAAKAAIRVGVIAAAIAAALMAAVGVLGYADQPGILVAQLGVGVLFAACAVGMWCGFSLAAAAALALCAFDLVMNVRALGGIEPLFHLSGGVFHVVLRWGVLPLALWAGFRGCEAWQRFLDTPPAGQGAGEP